MLCGADSFIEIVDFAEANVNWIKSYVDLSNGIPSHDTLTRVFSIINKDVFCDQFTRWTQHLQLRCKETEIEKDVIAIDGKTLCGAIGSNLSGLAHMLHAWSTNNCLCIAQRAVKDKSNEITAMIPLLEILDLKKKFY